VSVNRRGRVRSSPVADQFPNTRQRVSGYVA
jgi:hypothetical protein